MTSGPRHAQGEGPKVAVLPVPLPALLDWTQPALGPFLSEPAFLRNKGQPDEYILTGRVTMDIWKAFCYFSLEPSSLMDPGPLRYPGWH